MWSWSKATNTYVSGILCFSKVISPKYRSCLYLLFWHSSIFYYQVLLKKCLIYKATYLSSGSCDGLSQVLNLTHLPMASILDILTVLLRRHQNYILLKVAFLYILTINLIYIYPHLSHSLLLRKSIFQSMTVLW